jgi:D-alanine transaminase
MDALANINGEIMPLEAVRISALDRGFLLGDAVYEVLRVYRGKPWLEEGHFARLKRSLAEVRITGVDLDRLRKRMLDPLAASGFQEAILYIQITRGSAPRTHAFPVGATPLELLYVQPFTDPYQQARQTGTRVITRPDLRWERCDIKSTNLLANLLAAQAAKEAGCTEALLYLPDSTLTEGTHSSLFGVKGGALITASNSRAILPGMTRGLIINLARELKVPVLERNLQRSELNEVEELFLAGTTTEVLPIAEVDRVKIGTGVPGPVTKNLQRAYAEEIAKFAIPS